MLKEIKTELFYFKEILRYGYGLPSIVKYIKYKYFGYFEVEKLPSFQCELTPDFELHALCQKKDVSMLIWSLRSFLYFSGLCPKIVVHDDGSLDQKSANLLISKFSGLEVIFRADAEKMISSMSLSSELLKHRRMGHNLIIKLTDIFLLAKASRIMVMDSDVLFFNKPHEIIDFVSGKTPYNAVISRHNGAYDLMMKDTYIEGHNIRNKAEFMNSGLIIYDRKIIDRSKLEEYFNNTLRKPGDYFVEMTGWGSLIAQINFQLLSLDRYIIKGKPRSDTIMKHFTSPRRHELYVYGIDMVKKLINP